MSLKTNTASKVEAGAAGLPLFYRDPVLIRATDHANLGLLRTRDFGFCAKATAIPVVVGEFAAAGRYYPLVFSSDDHAAPLIVTGIKAGQNLFVGEDGRWRPGTYVPSYLRRYPFIGMASDAGGPLMLGMDGASDHVVSDHRRKGVDAEPLFDAAGAPTQVSRAAIALCEAYTQEHERTAAFAEALKANGLLIEKAVEIRYNDPARAAGGPVEGAAATMQVNGFRIVDEPAFRALPKDVVATFHANGWLDLIVLHLASQLSWQVLVDEAAPKR
ncbi:SapC family protein [Azorhizobium oxalatiphilum]|uniref:SapC family protein n=1 Tax=Azorhizobium oxalatiphilum TaxID=980631 RepID=A0A917BTF3_9HYPH|nr:SapC family protein [Azorhizobium oxalatiphilum]GGF56032.1 SapC family protein [Azorhizobium oxalatiphilum]